MIVLAFTSFAAVPVFAQGSWVLANQVGVPNPCPPGAAECDTPAPGSAPIWATINAGAQGNYAGGDEVFTVFVVDSATNTYGTATIDSMTLTAPFGSNFGIGLPTTLNPGQSIESTIHLPIPANYTGKSFVANLVVNARLWNGTGYTSARLTGSAAVDVFVLASSGQTTETAAPSGTVSTTLFAAGVAGPSIIAILLAVLLVRARAGPKRMA